MIVFFIWLCGFTFFVVFGSLRLFAGNRNNDEEDKWLGAVALLTSLIWPAWIGFAAIGFVLWLTDAVSGRGSL